MTYPLPVYHFIVDWGGTRSGFSEVSGLDVEVPVIEYREGSHPEYTPIKIPGLAKYGNVTLKRGIVRGDNEFFEWLATRRLDQIERRDVTIHLLDEEHAPVMTWKVKNGWPTKIEGPGLNASNNEIAIETLEIAHEGLTIENG